MFLRNDFITNTKIINLRILLLVEELQRKLTNAADIQKAFTRGKNVNPVLSKYGYVATLLQV